MRFQFPTALFASLVVTGLANAATTTIYDPAPYAAATGTSAANTSTDQANIGSGSWQANGTTKTSIGFSPEDLGFAAGTTISDVDSISFSTYKTTTGGSAQDWYLTIYTAPTGDPASDNGSSWYGVRMTFEGLYANNLSNPANQWNTYSTAVGTNQLTMLDSNTTNFGFYGGPTLDDIQTNNGVVDWSNFPTSSSTSVFDYDESEIIGFVIETGSGWAPGFEGYFDNLQISVGGSTTTVDFEPIPEPTTAALLTLASTLGLTRRRRS